jgi:AdoMet-dependent rRNA methyltransferase SPB1
MGKHKSKKGKNRLDKYYHLAKEQGYRSRAAFKLIQLNKKYNFLGSAQVLIDLCAAPGSWLQVAEKFMPVNKMIIGVDLVPIRPIRNVITLTEDITTEKCKHSLKKVLGGLRADVILHDGSPKVGTAWTHDAYTQSELVLMSVKLATDFLRPGGIYVTKVFRSKDYTKLQWVFKKLFHDVEATKPQASRGSSAEIYVVCRGYLSPKKIDPRIFDPREVFREIAVEPNSAELRKRLLESDPKKRSRNRMGYEDDAGPLLFKSTSVKQFIEGDDPIAILANHNCLVFTEDSKQYEMHSLTTEEIKECVKDLKVLGKADFKRLLKWRMKLREEFLQSKDENEGEDSDAVNVSDNTTPLTKEEMEERRDEQITEQLEEMLREHAKRKKKKERKKQRNKEKLLHKLGVSASQLSEQVDTAPDETLFSLKHIKTGQVLSNLLQHSSPDEIVTEDSSEDDETNTDEGNSADDCDDDPLADDNEKYNQFLDKYFDTMYQNYLQASIAQRKKLTAKLKERMLQKEDAHDLTEIYQTSHGIVQMESDTTNDKNDANPLLVTDPIITANKTKLWFKNVTSMLQLDNSTNKKMISALDDELDEELEVQRLTQEYLARKRKRENETDSVLTSESSQPKKLKVDSEVELSEDNTRLASRRHLTSQSQSQENSNSPETASRRAVNDEVPKNQSKNKKRVEVHNEEDTCQNAAATTTHPTEFNSQNDIKKEIQTETERTHFELYEGNRREKPNSTVVDSDTESEEFESAADNESDSDDYLDEDEKAEILAVARQMTFDPEKRKRLLDQRFSKISFNYGPDAPQWFIDEEREHYRPNLPITKDDILAEKERQKGINVRSIKKVVEAKARKRRKELLKQKKVKEQAKVILNSLEISDREKAKMLQKLLKKNASKVKPNRIYVVARKFQSLPKKKGFKIKLVDPRMKKDTRGLQRAQERKTHKQKKRAKSKMKRR